MGYNFAEKFSPKVVEAFHLASCTEGIFNTDYDWTGVATVNVYRVDDLPLQDYDWDETSTSRFGTLTELGDTIQTLTVNADKCVNGSIDKRNNTSTLMIKAANKVLARTTRNVIIPYVDAYNLNAMATGAGITGFGGAGGGTIAYNVTMTTSTAIRALMTGGVALTNKKVPLNDRVIYIGATKALEVKLADQVVGIDKIGEKAIVNGVCGMVDGMQVRIVPDDYMPTNVVFMIVRKGCAVAPKKVETARVLTENPNIDGANVQMRLLHDCFVLAGRADGIYVAKSTSGESGET